MASIWLEVLWKGQAATRGIAQTKQEIGGLKAAAANIWSQAGGLGGIAGIAGPVAIAVGALQGLRVGIREGIAGIESWESAAVRTTGTLENLGIKGSGAFADIEAAVNRVVETTRFGDDQLLDVANRLIEDTQDYATSLKDLEVVANLAAAKQIDLATAESIVAKVREGNNRAVGQMLPFMRSYAESLDGIVDPAERAAMMMQKLTTAVSGKAADELKTGRGLWLDYKDALGEFFEAGTKALHITEAWNAALKGSADRLREATSAMQGGGFFGINPMMMAGAAQGAGMVAPTAPVSSVLGPGNEEGIAKFQAVVEEFHQAIAKWSIENGISDDRQSMRRPGQRGRAYSPLQATGPGREFSLDEDALNAPFQRVKEIGQFVQTTISGAIVAGGTSGFDGFLASLKQTGLQALADLLGGALANIFAPGAGIGGGILGSIFGLGSSKSGLSATVERNLTRRQLRLA